MRRSHADEAKPRGDHAEAARVAQRLVEQAPDLKRNNLLLAGFLATAGRIDASRQHVEALLNEYSSQAEWR